MREETPFGDEVKNKDNKDMIHYQKINIFGEPGVGKSSFISYLENYDDNFEIKVQYERKESFQSIESNIAQSSLVEQIKKSKIRINKDMNLYLNVYETNIDRFDAIKMNLETLLFQTECIIIMWDNNVKTFGNIIELINTIKNSLKNIKDRNVPFILLQNKNDLEIDYGRPSDQDNDNNKVIDIDKSVDEIKKENPDFIFKKMCLLNRNDFINILLDIDRNIDRSRVENKNDVIDLVKVDYPINQLKDSNQQFSEIKIALLGDSNTGKTSFLHILTQKPIDEMTSTISIDSYIFYAYIKNEKYKIKISDTAGQENYRSIAGNYIKNQDGFLLFFDVTNHDSFKSIDYWREFINWNNLSKEIIILGNKIDESEKREVKKNEAKEYAEKYQIKYIECSCKAHINIYEILNEIILMSFNRFQEKENSNGSINLRGNSGNNRRWCC